MIQILIVDDDSSKQKKIVNTILDSHDINESDIEIADCIKVARKSLYQKSYDLMILDLVLPIEDQSECSPDNGVKFLGEIQKNPSIKPPIHIVGISGYKERVVEFHEQFSMKLWNLIEYEANSTNWQDQLNSIIYHLVKTRKNFLGASLENQIDLLVAKIEENNYPNTFLGSSWIEICRSIISVIEKAFDVPEKFSNGAKARLINSDTIKISSEYDFQNLIHLILRPWIPSVEPENIAIIFDGNTKYADFSIKGNSIIVEAKYIDSTGKKNDTLKTLEGLKKFYKDNSNIKCLIFLILVEPSVSIDFHKIEDEFSQELNTPHTIVKLIKNKLGN